ncbi:hypothetical protein B0J14DRAFT_480924, partial [Halenospora varia]
KMVRPRDVQGRIYTVKSKSECASLSMADDILPDIVRSHMVFVLEVIPWKKHYVKIMTATENEYVPISPTRKKPYAFQLRLKDCRTWSGLYIERLDKYSYLKIDEFYEVPIDMLEPVISRTTGEQMMCWARRQGGLAQLRDHIRRCDRQREMERLCLEMEKQDLAEQVEEEVIDHENIDEETA